MLAYLASLVRITRVKTHQFQLFITTQQSAFWVPWWTLYELKFQDGSCWDPEGHGIQVGAYTGRIYVSLQGLARSQSSSLYCRACLARRREEVLYFSMSKTTNLQSRSSRFLTQVRVASRHIGFRTLLAIRHAGQGQQSRRDALD